MALRLSKANKKKWKTNLLKFAIPPILIYLGSLSLIFGQQSHVFTFQDFIPNSVTLGALISYIYGSLMDLQKKLSESEQ